MHLSIGRKIGLNDKPDHNDEEAGELRRELDKIAVLQDENSTVGHFSQAWVCILLIVAATMVAANLAVDLAFGALDPRIRSLQKGAAR